MYTFDQFRADATEAFAFLETEHSMHRASAEAGVGAWIMYQNARMKVTVQYEIGSGVWTSFEDLTYQRKPLDTSRTFSVSDLVVNKDTAEPANSRDAVLRQAAILRDHGTSVLNGDFSLLHAKHDRLVQAMLRNRKKSV